MTRRATNPISLPRDGLTPAEKLTRTDDLMSDVLDACLWPTDPFPTPDDKDQTQKKRTIKFTPGYRRPRSLNIDDIKIIISRVQSGEIKNISEATLLIRQIPAVMSYIGKGEPPRVGKHIGLYLQLFQIKCGVKFCETDRYDQRRRALDVSTLPSTRASSCAPPESHLSTGLPGSSSVLGEITDSGTPTPSSTSSSDRPSRKSRRSVPVVEKVLNHRIHLAVFAARDYVVNDIVVGCEGSFADLTEEEDLRLRGVNPPIDGHPDFSHLVNSRGKFQVFCGPARFVNHDCQNNVVLLREGFTIKFKVVVPIKAHEEILTSYGANYFGEGNCECMCATCEENGRGFYSQQDHQGLSNSLLSSNEQLKVEEASEVVSNSDWSPSSGSIIKEERKKLLVLKKSSLHVEESTNNISLSTKELDQALVETGPPVASSSHQPPRRGRPPKKHIAQTEPKAPSPTPSRSSSLRRHPSRLNPSKLLTPSRRGFISQVNFTNTTDLRLPIYNLSGVPEFTKTVFEEDWPIEPLETSSSMMIEESSSNSVVDQVEEQVQVAVPARRKTYWITSKQRQLGLLPWENNQSSPSFPEQNSSVSGGPGQGRYSSITPSLLGPSGSQRRRLGSASSTPSSSQTNELGSKRKRENDEEVGIETRLPKRSYWISTKQKRLGILPWEPPPSSDPSSSTSNTPVRATRAALKAIEGVKPFNGLPSAPKGSRLNFRVIESGSVEAGLLGSAIGRELLGFRPVKNKAPVAEAKPCKPVEEKVESEAQEKKDGEEVEGRAGSVKRRRRTGSSAQRGRTRRKSKTGNGSGSVEVQKEEARDPRPSSVVDLASGSETRICEGSSSRGANPGADDSCLDRPLGLSGNPDGSLVVRGSLMDRELEDVGNEILKFLGDSLPIDQQVDGTQECFSPRRLEKEDSDDSVLTSPPPPPPGPSCESLQAPQPVIEDLVMVNQDEEPMSGENRGEENENEEKDGERSMVMMRIIDRDQLDSGGGCTGIVKSFEGSEIQGEIGVGVECRNGIGNGNGLGLLHQQQQQNGSEGSVLSELEDSEVDHQQTQEPSPVKTLSV